MLKGKDAAAWLQSLGVRHIVIDENGRYCGTEPPLLRPLTLIKVPGDAVDGTFEGSIWLRACRLAVAAQYFVQFQRFIECAVCELPAEPFNAFSSCLFTGNDQHTILDLLADFIKAVTV